ncbi:MAG: hypothetical protein WCC22_00175 [Terriglobales bacterium]
MTSHPTPIQRITPQEMRRRFNDGNYWGRAQKGEFSTVVIEDRHPSLTLANEPFCTRSQMVSYRDDSNSEIARVHQYLRPDKSLGASKKPDPKRLLENGILYRLIKGKP